MAALRRLALSCPLPTQNRTTTRTPLLAFPPPPFNVTRTPRVKAAKSHSLGLAVFRCSSDPESPPIPPRDHRTLAPEVPRCYVCRCRLSGVWSRRTHRGPLSGLRVRKRVEFIGGSVLGERGVAPSTFNAAVNRTPAREARQVPKSGPAGRRSGCTACYGAFACIASDYPVPTQTSRSTCSKADAQRQSSRARRLQRVSCSAELGCITSPPSRETGPIRVTTFPSIPLHRTYLTFSDRSTLPA
jgi:hypothetical protein